MHCCCLFFSLLCRCYDFYCFRFSGRLAGKQLTAHYLSIACHLYDKFANFFGLLLCLGQVIVLCCTNGCWSGQRVVLYKWLLVRSACCAVQMAVGQVSVLCCTNGCCSGQISVLCCTSGCWSGHRVVLYKWLLVRSACCAVQEAVIRL